MACVVVLAGGASVSRAGDHEFFESRIRPVLVKHCYECHSAAAQPVKGGLLLDFRDGLRKGGDSGPAIVPGKPEESLLLGALRHETFEMPPAGKLPPTVIADFQQWIRDGAVDPRDRPPSSGEAGEAAWRAQFAERTGWWSLQPPTASSPPEVADAAWSGEPVDRFVHAALTRAGLTPASPAAATQLARRLSLVLTGLPLAPERATTFSSAFDSDPDAAVAALVDELLESPHFGERFARHWMDVVRYTDTYGYEWDNPAKGAFEYRDYLIRAFNADVGFDQLIREQLAGDLLPTPRIDAVAGVQESLIGPMFYHLGEHRHGSSLDFNGIHQEMVNNKIEAFSTAFLAMTVACARCHNHKLDAISQADYYSLAGVFMSPRWATRVVDAPGKHDAAISELTALRDDIRGELARHWNSQAGDMSARLRHWTTANRAALEKSATEDLPHPLAAIAAASDATIAAAWTALGEQWRSAHETRLAANAAKFETLADFSKPGFPEGWVVEGDGIAHGYVAHGAPRVSLEGDTLIDQLLPRGYHTHALSSRLPGAVRLPPQEALPRQFVSLELQGGEWSGFLVVPQNAFQSETVTFLQAASNSGRWQTIADRELKNGVTRVRTEIATASLNPNFPPRTGLATAGGAKLPDDDDGFEKRSWFSLTGAVAHDDAGAPQDTLDAFAALFEGEPPATCDDAWSRVAAWCNASLTRWTAGRAVAADVSLLNWLLAEKLLSNQAAEAPAAAALVRRYREVEARIAFPRTVNSMDERQIAPLEYRLNIRGNVDDDGPAVPRDFLEVFAGQHRVAESDGSGRLELADYLASRAHPQTARVYVNRVWHWVFGAGLVATPSDFGKLGGRPSHPELLDWLAVEFMREGWSTKKLVRRLVLSRTFRQGGAVSREAVELDPDNRLLHHYPTRRLEAEAIRDSLLAVSGRLDRSLYGPPVNPPRTVEDGKKRLFSGPLDGGGRRSIYLQMSIMDPPKFLVCFNLPDLKLPTGRRDVTNVPAQALALLNDPLVIQLAEHWAARLMSDGCGSPEERIGNMFLAALGRRPTDAELQRWAEAVAQFSQASQASQAGELMSDQQAWAELGHALFNAKQFIYYE